MLALLLLDCLVFGLLRSSKSPTLVRQLFFLCITALTRRLTTFLHAVTSTILGGLSPSQSYRLLRMGGVLTVILITIRPSASVSSISSDALLYRGSLLLVLSIILTLLCDTPRSHATFLIRAALYQLMSYVPY